MNDLASNSNASNVLSSMNNMNDISSNDLSSLNNTHVNTSNNLSTYNPDETSDLLTSLEIDNVDISTKEALPSYRLSPSIREKLDHHSELVNKTYDIFKDIYGNAMRPTVVSSIINGEIIETKPENIFVNEAIKFDDPTFEKKCSFCAKQLYDYQKNAIKKIRELELRGYAINRITNEKIISNGWLLSLPIGSGKSLVFQFLALFYRDIPSHPIIISTDGHNIPDHDQMQWKYYPYFYENCGYIDGKPNSVIALSNYKQRVCTVILTHMHLMDQMNDYFVNDFPTIMRTSKGRKARVNVIYPMSLANIHDINNVDIIVVPATQDNVDKLVEWSYDAPFMRVIIDDYTSMPNIDSFRQILATSTIFVSGSGFDRKEIDIPSSYYTLKYMPVSKISLVGKPEETLEGIFRDSIATMELMGSSCEFSQYEFVTFCDDIVRQMFKSTPTNIYPPLRDRPLIHNYMALMFVIRYMDRIKSAIQMVERDMNVINEKTGKKKLDEARISYYLQWKKIIADVEKNKPPIEKRKRKDGTIEVRYAQPSLNPLYMYLYVDPGVGQSVGSSLVQQECYCCHKRITDHNGYGMLACCCGAFFCSNCLKSMCTHEICDKRHKHRRIHDNDNYYCVCCRHKNPKYYFNVNKKKDTNVYSYNLVNDYFDTTDLKDHTMFDYYFYMFLHGFTPLYHEGKPINIQNDIEQGNLKSENLFDKMGISLGVVPLLEKVLPKDQLGILAISTINKTLHDLSILPRKGATILFYGCPKYMINRVVGYANEIIRKNDPATALTVANSDGNKKNIQPLNNMSLDFKDSV